MRLYHWAPSHLIESIKKEGLTHGCTPFIGEDGDIDFLRGHIWLTSDGTYDGQKWAIPVSIPYSRRAWRIEVNIPVHDQFKVVHSSEIARMLGDSILPGFLDDQPEITKKWYVHYGAIPRQWFKSVRCME